MVIRTEAHDGNRFEGALGVFTGHKRSFDSAFLFGCARLTLAGFVPRGKVEVRFLAVFEWLHCLHTEWKQLGFRVGGGI